MEDIVHETLVEQIPYHLRIATARRMDQQRVTMPVEAIDQHRVHSQHEIYERLIALLYSGNEHVHEIGIVRV